MFDPAHQGFPLVRGGARIYAELIEKAEQMRLPGISDKPAPPSDAPKAGPKFIEMPKASAAAPTPPSGGAAKPSAPVGPPSISTKPAPAGPAKPSKVGPPGVQIPQDQSKFQPPAQRPAAAAGGPPSIEAPKAGGAGSNLPQPPTVKIGGGPPMVNMPKTPPPTAAAGPAGGGGGPPGIQSPVKLESPAKKEPEQLQLPGVGNTPQRMAPLEKLVAHNPTANTAGKPASAAPPAGPASPEPPQGSEGGGSKSPQQQKTLMAPGPSGPSPMDWFHYGQSQGQMTAQQGGAAGILPAHVGRVLGAAQGALSSARGASARENLRQQREGAQQRQLMATRQAGAGGGVVTQPAVKSLDGTPPVRSGIRRLVNHGA